MAFTTVSTRADEGRAHLHAFGERIIGASGRTPERLLEVGDGLVALGALDLAQRFLVVLGHVDVDDQAPLLAVHALAVLGRRLLADLPLIGQRLRPARQPRAQREHAEAVTAGRDHPGRRHHAGHRDREVRMRVGRQVQARLPQLEPVGLHGDRLLALEELHDGVERLVHPRPLRHRLDAEHVGVGHQRARAAAEHGAAARHVVELHEALRPPGTDGGRAGSSRRSRA